MHQIELLELTLRMRPGQCVAIDSGEIREAASDGLPVLDRPARDDDVRRFVRTITSNWDIDVVHDLIRDTYTIHKLPPNKKSTER